MINQQKGVYTVANDNKTPNVGHSTSITIGGKTFKTSDVSRLTPQTKEVQTVKGTENAPRDITKTLQNEAGTIKTDNLERGRSVTPSINTSSFTAHSTPVMPSQNIQTETARIQAAQGSAKSYTDYYTSTNVQKSGDAGLTHQFSISPVNVQGIKTTPVNQQVSSPLPKPSLSSPSSTTEERSENISKPSIVASRQPQSGVSIGAAYFTTLAAGQHNSLKSNLDTSGVQTASMAAKAAEARAVQGMLQGSYTPSHIIKNTGLEAKASFYEAMGRYGGNSVSLTQNAKGAIQTGGSMLVGRVQGAFGSHDDMGSQVAGGAVTAGVAAYTGFKMAQTASPLVINAVQGLPTTVGKTVGGVVGVGKGAWDVTTTAGKATVTLAKTAGIMSSGFVPFNAQFTKATLLNQAQITGLLHTATSQKIISSVTQIQSNIINMKANVVSTARGIQTGVVTATNAVKRSYALVRGVANGSIMSSVVAHDALLKAGALAKGAGLRGLKIAGKGVATGAVKGGIWTLKVGVPKSTRAVGSLSMGLAGVLTSSNDMMLQGVGHTVMLSNYGIKTSLVAGKFTGRAVKTSVKGGIGAAKGTWKAANFIRQKGLRAAWARARSKTAGALVNAGKSAISAILNLAKALGQKAIVPVLLIAIAVSAIMGLFSAPVVSIGGIFSGLFDTKNADGTYTETDIRTFITDPTNGIPAKRTKYINDLAAYLDSQWESNGGAYDYVRFKTNASDDVIEPTVAGITSEFYTQDELCNIIQPIFNAVILEKYELAPTDAEAKATLTEIFDKLFRYSGVATTEWCGQSAIDGSGSPNAAHSCGRIHALGDCPNHETGTHSSYTCSSCCYMYCDGHVGTDSEGNPTITYCSGCKHACTGYDYCGGHDVYTVTLTMDGLYQLLYEYFEQPIDTLSNKTNRTEDEEHELQNLKDAYEICLEYINQVAQLYGGGLSMDDLSGVTFINGSRVGNQAVIDLALSQAGQVGGQPYWSWYGFSSRVEWCACFVSWCMNQTGHSEVRYASCQYGGVPYFQGAGRWANGGYTDLVAGDVIFFDWEGDGKANHTGLVIGTDGQFVYTIEGNSGDTCRMKQYAINSSVILGYGLMNY